MGINSEEKERRKTGAPQTLPFLEFVVLTAMLTSLAALSIDAILPALDRLGQELNASSVHQQQLSVSLFFVGMALGQLFFGPFSDAKGRVPAILLGIGIFIVGSLICMFATDMTLFLFGRIVQAFGASGPRIGCMALVRDIFVGNAMAKVMSFIMVVFIIVPMLAPVIGQWVMLWHSWQAIFSVIMVLSTLTGIWFFVRQPETHRKENRRPFELIELLGSAKYILCHRKVINYIFVTGYVFGAFLAYLSASQTIFVGFYQAEQTFPYLFALLAFSIGMASFFNGKMVMKFGMHTLVRFALFGAIIFSMTLYITLLIYSGLPPMALLVALFFAGFFFIGVLFGNVNAIAMEPLGHIAGLGAAIIGSLTSAMAVCVAVLIDSFLIDNLYPIAIGFLICFGLAKTHFFLANKNT